MFRAAKQGQPLAYPERCGPAFGPVRIVLVGDHAWQVRMAGEGWLKSIHAPDAASMAIDPNCSPMPGGWPIISACGRSAWITWRPRTGAGTCWK